MSEQPKRIGILGAGQLALMLAEAAAALRAEVVCAGAKGDCAEQVAAVVEVDLTDAAAVADFARQVDLVTVESENIDAAVLEGLKLFPNARAIGIAQDRLLEKNFFRACGLSTAPFVQIDSLEDLTETLNVVGLPAILKTRRMGYDGKGQFRMENASDAERAWEAVGAVPCILEGMVRFEAEVSLIAARNASGDTAFYPLIENFHRDGILRLSLAPYVDAALQRAAEQHVARLLRELEYVGVLAVEFFIAKGELVANEMAPRVHNSGHWTIEGSRTSQFENHLRAGLGMPLGDTGSRPMAMLNCIGDMPPLSETARFAAIARHDYRKEPRAGRKVGHLTLPREAEADIREWQRRMAAS